MDELRLLLKTIRAVGSKNPVTYIQLSEIIRRLWRPRAKVYSVFQEEHGFTVGDVIKPADPLWVKAKADTAANAKATAVVCDIIDDDNFIFLQEGIVSGDYIKGKKYFLSITTAGKVFVNDTETWTVGNYRQMIGTGTADGLLVEIDEGGVWNGSSSDEMVCLMTPEFIKSSPSGFLHSEYFTATTYPESERTLIIPNLTKITGNSVTNIYYITINGQSEFVLPQRAIIASIRVFRNLSRLHPSKYVISNGIVTVLLPLLEGETIRIFFDLWKDDKWIYNEVPTGLIDGTNQEFYLAEEPNPDLLELSKNGELMHKWQYTVDGLKITTIIQTEEGDWLLADYPTCENQNKIYNEIPTGAIDGINKIFALGRSPTPGTVRFFHNGKRQQPAEEITITDDHVEFYVAPMEEDEVLVDYDFT